MGLKFVNHVTGHVFTEIIFIFINAIDPYSKKHFSYNYATDMPDSYQCLFIKYGLHLNAAFHSFIKNISVFYSCIE